MSFKNLTRPQRLALTITGWMLDAAVVGLIGLIWGIGALHEFGDWLGFSS